MPLPRDLVGLVRRLDEQQLRHLLILARGLLLTSEVPVVEIDDLPGMPAVRYRQRAVACGKDACTACPHGPYWYAHWTEGGRRRSRYIGVELPAEVRRKLEALDRARAAAASPDEDCAPEAVAVAAGRADGHPDRGTRGRLRLVTD